MAKRIAVVLCNLGGPDNLESVGPFLFNLFYDKAIIRLPNPLRWVVAKKIAGAREKEAKEIYKLLGGKSPILENTQAQANALEQALNEGRDAEYKVFIAMRYWKPMTYDTAIEVKRYNPDDIIVLPLYPQYSTTTTQSSLDVWNKAAKKQGLDNIPTHEIQEFHVHPTYIKAHCELVQPIFQDALTKGNTRILFSAHGLPKKIIDAGDSYQEQVVENAKEIIRNLGYNNVDFQVCYQSKVGKLEWIGPSTEEEILEAAEQNLPIIIVPIAFVSEHSETLVELDIEYKELAEKNGLTDYTRIPALGTHPTFIHALKELCLEAA